MRGLKFASGACMAGVTVTALSGFMLSAGGLAQVRAATFRPVHVTMTTPDLSYRLTPLRDVTLSTPPSGTPALGIDDSVTYQTIDGFGAAFTDSATYLLGQKLSAAAQNQVLTDLFSRTSGIGLSLMRIPMGSSDFTATPVSSPDTYSYDDNSGTADQALSHFSIRHDMAYTIPVILRAQQLNPSLKLLANPWSPPGWMKADHSMLGQVNNVIGTLQTESYSSFAQYFVKFIQAYQNAGIKIWAITPQNEPTNPVSSYSGMLLPADTEATIIGSYLAPALQKAGLTVKILAGDDVGANLDYAKTIIGNTQADKAIYGTAWHCYYNDLNKMTQIAQLDPSKRLYMTECSTGPGIAPMTATQAALESTNFGASGALLWNLALDTNGGPKMGSGCTNCDGLVTIDQNSGSVTYTRNYYELGQLSKFIVPGATSVKRIDGNGLWSQAYRNPDGSEVLVVNNTTSSSATATVQWNTEGSFTYTLPAGSTTTFSRAAP